MRADEPRATSSIRTILDHARIDPFLAALIPSSLHPAQFARLTSMPGCGRSGTCCSPSTLHPLMKRVAGAFWLQLFAPRRNSGNVTSAPTNALYLEICEAFLVSCSHIEFRNSVGMSCSSGTVVLIQPAFSSRWNPRVVAADYHLISFSHFVN